MSKFGESEILTGVESKFGASTSLDDEAQELAQRQSTEAERVAKVTGYDPALFAGDAQPTADELGLEGGSVGGFAKDAAMNVAGLPETALSIGSQAVAPIAAGLIGLESAALRAPAGEAYKAGDDVKAIQQALSFQPKTDVGKAMLDSTVGLIGSAADAVGLTDAIQWLEESGKEAGDAGEAMGLPPSVNALLQTAPQMLPEMLALVTQTRHVKPLLEAAAKADLLAPAKAVGDIQIPQTKAKQQIAKRLMEGDLGKGVAGYKLDAPEDAPVIYSEGVPQKQLPTKMDVDFDAPEQPLIESIDVDVKPQRAVKDPLQTKAIDMGFDKKHIPDFVNASPATKAGGREIVKARRKALERGRDEIDNRSSDVIGLSVFNRIKALDGDKEAAGKALGAEAQKLRGKNIDTRSAFEDFRDDLIAADVSVDADSGKLIFKGSILDDVVGARIVNNVFERARVAMQPKIKDGVPQGNAYELHKLKQYIDNKVSYKKHGKEGLDAAGERIVSKLRHNLNEKLRDLSPQYKKENIKYKAALDGIEGLDDIITSKIDVTDPRAVRFLGTKMRGVMSNADYGSLLINALDDIEKTIVKHGHKFSDDPITLTQINQQLDEVMGTQAKTSAQGIADQELSRQFGDRSSTLTGLGVTGVKALHGKFKGRTPERQLDALEGLLNPAKKSEK
jgi:hypothetical protein